MRTQWILVFPTLQRRKLAEGNFTHLVINWSPFPLSLFQYTFEFLVVIMLKWLPHLWYAASILHLPLVLHLISKPLLVKLSNLKFKMRMLLLVQIYHGKILISLAPKDMCDLLRTIRSQVQIQTKTKRIGYLFLFVLSLVDRVTWTHGTSWPEHHGYQFFFLVWDFTLLFVCLTTFILYNTHFRVTREDAYNTWKNYRIYTKIYCLLSLLWCPICLSQTWPFLYQNSSSTFTSFPFLSTCLFDEYEV